jgi:hypothetical protein
MGAELFHADRQTDMILTVAFRNFANAPKNIVGDAKFAWIITVYIMRTCLTGINASLV